MIEQEEAKKAQGGLGKAKIGGAFELYDQDGQKRTEKSFLGNFVLIYFGFTHCPDVCPDELDKMALVIDAVDSVKKFNLIPLFISCDPQRDSPEVIKEYLKGQ